MTVRVSRRFALLAPLLLASCGGGDDIAPPVRIEFPPLRYGYLPPISLNVQRVEVAGDYVPPSGDDEVGAPGMAETLYAMARDRLKPVANSGVATFRILMASVKRHGDTLNGLLAVRLDVHDAGDTNSGFAEARATATKTGPISDLRGATYDMLKSMMDDLNVELEFQMRNKLRAWVVEPATDVPAQPVNPPVNPQPRLIDPSPKLPPPPPAPPLG